MLFLKRFLSANRLQKTATDDPSQPKIFYGKNATEANRAGFRLDDNPIPMYSFFNPNLPSSVNSKNLDTANDFRNRIRLAHLKKISPELYERYAAHPEWTPPIDMREKDFGQPINPNELPGSTSSHERTLHVAGYGDENGPATLHFRYGSAPGVIPKEKKVTMEFPADDYDLTGTLHHEGRHVLTLPAIFGDTGDDYSTKLGRPFSRLLTIAGHPGDTFYNRQDVARIENGTTRDLNTLYSQIAIPERVRNYRALKDDAHKFLGQLARTPEEWEDAIINSGLAIRDKQGNVILTDKGQSWDPPSKDTIRDSTGKIEYDRNEINRQLRINNAIRRWENMPWQEKAKIDLEERRQIDDYIRRFRYEFSAADNKCTAAAITTNTAGGPVGDSLCK